MKLWIQALALALTVAWSAPSAAWWWDTTPSNYTDTRYPVEQVWYSHVYSYGRLEHRFPWCRVWLHIGSIKVPSLNRTIALIQ